MGSQLLASKTVTQDEPPQVRSLPSPKTAVLCIVGITKRGPVGTAVFTTSFDEWRKTFGGDCADSQVVHCIRSFYQGGGQFVWTVRTGHYSDLDAGTATSAKGSSDAVTSAAAATAGAVIGTSSAPWDLEPGDTLAITLDAAGTPHTGTATFAATAAARETTGGSGAWDFTGGKVLKVKIDQGTEQVITFVEDNFSVVDDAQAEEVAAVINAQLSHGHADVTSTTKVSIISDKRGYGSFVEIEDSTAATTLGFVLTEVRGTGTQNLLDIDAVTALEAKAVIEAASGLAGNLVVSSAAGCLVITSATTGANSSVHVSSGSTADDEIGLDNATHSGWAGTATATLRAAGKYDGAYVEGIKFRVAAATSGVASEFNLSVEDGGVTVESWPNVTMDDAAARYVETIANAKHGGSDLLTFADLDATGAPYYGRPANGLYGPLTGGDDGLASIGDNDFLGSSIAKSGLYALNGCTDGTLLAVPDQTTPAVHQGMYQYSEIVTDGRLYCLLDPPAGETESEAVTYFAFTALLYQATENGHYAWPRPYVLNPDANVYGNDAQVLTVASGMRAAAIARHDAQLAPPGVFEAAAGVENGRLVGCVGLETEVTRDEAVRDLLNPMNIAPIWAYEGSGGYFVDGSRNCKTNGNWPSMGEVRGTRWVQQTVKLGLDVYRHRNNTRRLRMECDCTVRAFLLPLCVAGAFRSTDPAKAFFVDFGDGLNTEAVQFQRKLLGRVGLATAKPAEFIVLPFSQDVRALEEELAIAQ